MEVFRRATEQDESARPAYLEAACAGDGDLRREVELLLAADARASFGATPISAGEGARVLAAELARESDRRAAAASSALPERLGSYRITGKIGEGGMGVVYCAVQENPHREVAIKALKPGIATAATLRRFEHEALVLGWLQHAGIARIYEASTSERPDGSPPFISMEYVRGASLTEYLKARRPPLSMTDRLRLFIRVCEAVAYAHQRGIIHRDLKPSNIMIEESGQPKILDFGVARLMDGDMQAGTLHTRPGEVVGTLAYMSPEQVGGDNKEVDTRSDVYSLGVILYEMLTGCRPHVISTLSWIDAARVLREEPPTPPSAHNTAVRGDLETIVCKALAKDKSRRYQSAAELAADVERYLAREPISARRDSAWYVFRKTLARHRTAAALGGVLAMTIVGATIALGIMYGAQGRALERAETSRTRAEAEAARADAINTFLLDMLASVDPAEARGREITLRELLDEAAADVMGTALSEQPEVRAAIMSTIGRTYAELGRYDEAEPLFVSALDIYRGLHAGDHADVAAALHQLGSLAHQRGHFARAEEWYHEALAMRRRLFGSVHLAVADTIASLGSAHWALDKRTEAEALNREALAIRRQMLGDEHISIAQSLHNLALAVRALGRYDEAIQLYKEALAMRRRLMGNDHPDVVYTLNNLGFLLYDLDRLDEAEPLLREALETRRRVLPANHPHLALSLNNYAQLLRKKNDLKRARTLALEALALHRMLGNDAHPFVVADTLANLGRIHEAMSDPAGAEIYYREALDRHRQLWGRGYFRTLRTLRSTIGVLVAQGHLDEARPLVAELIEFEKAEAAKPDATVRTLNGCAWLLLTCEPADLREPATALALAQRAVERTPAPDPDILDTLALAYAMTGDRDKAILTQEAALRAVPADDADRKKLFEQRLAQFRSGEPVPPPAPGK